jgi:catechol 2,3-dioxygenase
MPVRKPVFDPPFNVVRASHVELGVRDLARSRAFYVDCLGLLVTDETENAIYLRAVKERNHHSIVLHRSRESAVHALGFKVASEEDLDRAALYT